MNLKKIIEYMLLLQKKMENLGGIRIGMVMVILKMKKKKQTFNYKNMVLELVIK